uniref:Uncharacterized protein n=1 Tax=Nelumbo nucifera TaxID=4432 RepID=A0A822ZEQ8_NELNU|nr:TPA_asm: hypothetical protein HUJ06_001842 [Nelumbo nucifera]
MMISLNRNPAKPAKHFKQKGWKKITNAMKITSIITSKSECV